MNKLMHALLLIMLFNSCHEREVSCDEGTGQRFYVENQEGWIFFDDRFDAYVVRHHVEGTIDAFRTYVICNVTKDLEGEEKSIVFSGEGQPLKEKYYPNILIAGEDFFVILLDDVTLDSDK
ncbi:MAG: hypothetical protein RIF36_01520 [Imperialibacter sp.]|uniref:hypothetical protein n=1 Tax=Imperialibacter sp. TaxID=2038411 RepID=UPI0032EB4A53